MGINKDVDQPDILATNIREIEGNTNLDYTNNIIY